MESINELTFKNISSQNSEFEHLTQFLFEKYLDS